MNTVHAFSSQKSGSRVVSIAVHPGTSDVFLVAYDTGCLAVFVAQRRCAVLTLSCQTPVLAAVWHPGCNDHCATVSTCGHIAVFHISSGSLKADVEHNLQLPEGVTCSSARASTWGYSGDIQDKENASSEVTGADCEQHVLVIGLSTGACIYHVLSGAQEKSGTQWKADEFVEKLFRAGV
jgi:hypothetical protein